MSHLETVRAWKDEDYRYGLSDAQLASMPENPAGLIELADSELTDDKPIPMTITVTLPICPTLYTPFSCITVCPVQR